MHRKYLVIGFVAMLVTTAGFAAVGASQSDATNGTLVQTQSDTVNGSSAVTATNASSDSSTQPTEDVGSGGHAHQTSDVGADGSDGFTNGTDDGDDATTDGGGDDADNRTTAENDRSYGNEDAVPDGDGVTVDVGDGERPTGPAAKLSTSLRRLTQGDHVAAQSQFVTGDEVTVTLRAAPGRSDEAVAHARGLGDVGTVYGTLVEVTVPVASLEPLADDPAVGSVAEPDIPVETGHVTRGVGTINATAAQARGYNGTAVDVAVIDSGFDPTDSEIASNVVETKDFTGTGFGTNPDHGTASAQLVNDTAPNVSLHLYKVGTNVDIIDAIDHIEANRSAIDVVTMSLSFPGARNDGAYNLDQRIDQAVGNDSFVHFNSAGNYGDFQHWSGTWNDPNGNNVHNFTTGTQSGTLNTSANDELLELWRLGATTGNSLDVRLQWDQYPTSNNDYNLVLANATTGAVLATSTDAQTGTQPPDEALSFTPASAGQYHAVVLINTSGSVSGNADFDLWSPSGNVFIEWETDARSVAPPSTAVNATAIGAIDSFDESLEAFSSRGPTIDGRMKPDISAPDNVTTSTIDPFYGTSAASPYAAGAAALLYDWRPSLTPEQVESYLAGNATPITGTEPDNLVGAGLVDVNDSITTQAAGSGLNDINSCRTINASNRPSDGLVNLTGDITDSSLNTCINVTVGNLTLDGNGHTVDAVPNKSKTKHGIDLHNGSTGILNVTVRNVTVTQWGDHGIEVQDAASTKVAHVNVTNTSGGINVAHSPEATVADSFVKDSDDRGILIGFIENVSIRNVTIERPQDRGIRTDGNRTTIQESTVRGAPNAIAITGDDATVTDTDLLNSSGSGILVSFGANGTGIERTLINGSAIDGISVADGFNTVVRNSTIAHSGSVGVRAVGNTGLNLMANAITDNDDGVRIERYDDVVVENNNVLRNGEIPDKGLWLDRTTNVTVADNNISANGWVGVRLNDTSGSSLRGNRMVGNGHTGIRAFSVADTRLIADNVSDNEQGVDVGKLAGQDDARNVTVRDAVVAGNNGTGVKFVSGVSDATLENLTVRNNNGTGITLFTSTNGVTIARSTILRNDDVGVAFRGATNSVVRNSTVRDNGPFAVDIGTLAYANVSAENVSIGASTSPDTRFSASGLSVGIAANGSPPSDPPGYASIGRYLNVTGTAADAHTLVNVSYDTADVAGSESDLHMWKYNASSGWVNTTDVPGIDGVDTANDYVYTNTSEFSVLAPMEPTGSANMTATVTGTNSPVMEDSQLNVTANVTNVGNASGSQTVDLLINGTVQDSQSVSLAAGDSTSVDLGWVTGSGDAGTWNATVATANDSDARLVEVLEPANFSVSVTATNAPVVEGDTLDVTANVTNLGDANGTDTVTLDVAGAQRDGRTVALAGGASTTVTLSWSTTAGDNGSYTATVASTNDTASTGVTVLANENFSVTITGSNSPVTEGGTLDVTANVTNFGDVSGTQDVALVTDGTVRDTTAVTLASGGSTTVTLSWATTSGDAGSYTGVAASQNDSDTAGVTVLAPANFSVAIESTNSPVTVNETLNVTANVTNVGDLSGTQTVALDVGGTQRDSASVTLAAGASQPVTLSWTTGSGDAGSYTAVVASANDSDTTGVSVQTASGGGGGGGGSTNTDPDAAMDIDPSTPETGATTTFDASGSSDPDGAIDRYRWEIDGTQYSGETVDVTFNEARANYYVELTVVDDDLGTDTTNTMFEVTATDDGTETIDAAAGNETDQKDDEQATTPSQQTAGNGTGDETVRSGGSGEGDGDDTDGELEDGGTTRVEEPSGADERSTGGGDDGADDAGDADGPPWPAVVALLVVAAAGGGYWYRQRS